MIKINESDYPNIVSLEVDGNLTKEDAEKADGFIKEHYGEDASVNALIYVKNIEGASPGGILKGAVMDIKHWNQYGKFAVVTDTAWIEEGVKFADIAPGIEMKQFDKDQVDQALEWLQR
ncbi:STAS/SEC14 domain-containing protein [Salinicoccus albus]|uniref:STAS/SEC14 domain-containing protein n=1 Tax=Salinicoccus albus TaxID=418756 RepID=UPI000381C3BF|nr:STAS/SEC14 domain-containing protein [Salinicoccus albus]